MSIILLRVQGTISRPLHPFQNETKNSSIRTKVVFPTSYPSFLSSPGSEVRSEVPTRRTLDRSKSLKGFSRVNFSVSLLNLKGINRPGFRVCTRKNTGNDQEGRFSLSLFYFRSFPPEAISLSTLRLCGSRPPFSLSFMILSFALLVFSFAFSSIFRE